MKPPVKPYKARVYRSAAAPPAPVTPPVKMRRKTVSEEIADIEAGFPPPRINYEAEREPPQLSWWERIKAAWLANLRS